MSKTITLNNKIETSIRSICVRNDDSIFSIKINKHWLLTRVKRFVISIAFLGYATITYISYTIHIEIFWTLLKIGIILSMLLCIAINKR